MNSGNDQPTQDLPADPVIAAYQRDVDKTLLRENLKLTVQERFEKHRRILNQLAEVREAGRRARRIG